MTRRGVLGLLAGVGSVTLVGCGAYGESTYRVRVTVEVETPKGLRRGMSVLQVMAAKNVKILPDERAGDSGLRGEAVAVDTDAGVIFVLLKPLVAGNTLQGAITGALAPGAGSDGIDSYVAAVRGLGSSWTAVTADLPRADWPMMVRFRDMKDPKTVERVEPEAIGVKRIRLETTSDAVTTGIDKQIPWLIEAENFHYAGTPAGDLYPTDPMDIRRGVK